MLREGEGERQGEGMTGRPDEKPSIFSWRGSFRPRGNTEPSLTGPASHRSSGSGWKAQRDSNSALCGARGPGPRGLAGIMPPLSHALEVPGTQLPLGLSNSRIPEPGLGEAVAMRS